MSFHAKFHATEDLSKNKTQQQVCRLSALSLCVTNFGVAIGPKWRRGARLQRVALFFLLDYFKISAKKKSFQRASGFPILSYYDSFVHFKIKCKKETFNLDVSRVVDIDFDELVVSERSPKFKERPIC